MNTLTRVDRLIVARIERPTARVCEIHLQTADGGELPSYAPGSNLQINAGGKWNAYSLTGLGVRPREYVISVLRQGAGSAWLHEQLTAGAQVEVAGPENAFAPDLRARRVLLVAGGIGVTPILSYARAARFWGWEAEAIYSHSAAEGAYADELRELTGGALIEVEHRDQLTAAMTERFQNQPLGTSAYACGPEGMIDLFTSVAVAQGWPTQRLHSERFSAAELDPGEPFDFRVAGERAVHHVPAGVSLLEKLLELGHEVPNMCRQGVCGRCLISVEGGTVTHRDFVLDERERAANDCMISCVSRGTGDGLEVAV